jgi:xanthine dehydrogenase accessory factor
MNDDTDATLLDLEQRLTDEARPFAVVTVIRAASPTSTWVGAQALVEADGTLHGWIGGGCSRAIVIDAARHAIRCGQPKRLRIANEPTPPEAGVESHAMPCASNGALELFIQPTVPAPLVLVLGATPTALEACVLAARMGLRVCAAASVGAPLAALGLQRVIEGFDAAAFGELAPQSILVATQGEHDEEALEAALRTPGADVLLVASQRKADALRDAMRARGIAPERLAALHAPAGPRIHARTPQEIALGAVAGLVALRREREQAAADAARAVLAESGAVPAVPPCEAMTAAAGPKAAGYRNPVCGMAVDPASAKHVVEAGGERVYFCCDGCKVEFERAPDRYLALQRQARQRETT